MFENLTERLDKFLRNVRGQGKISEDNVRDTVREVRRILLEADVGLTAVKAFVSGIQERALGREVFKSVTPGQMMVKIIHDELVEFLGGQAEPIQFGKSPSTIMMVGLNGTGKTTTCAKLAVQLRRMGRKPLLAACDRYRPAAIDQLASLAKQVNIPVYTGEGSNAVKIASEAREYAKQHGLDCVIIDTAGRMHINEELMDELVLMQSSIKPPETLLVVDGMTGQDAVKSAQQFSDKINLTGLILTKLDGDARGGAALSIRWVTGKPIKFVGVGEKTSDLELFYPDRMAGRIMGMGDVVTLVERAQEVIEADSARRTAEKLTKREFTLEDFREQIEQLKKMGPLESILGMIPGLRGNLKNLQVEDSQIKVVQSIIDSMTPAERRSPRIIDGSRRKRIARGSGRTVQDINRLLNQFEQMQKMFKQFGKRGGKFKGFPGMPGM